MWDFTPWLASVGGCLLTARRVQESSPNEPSLGMDSFPRAPKVQEAGRPKSIFLLQPNTNNSSSIHNRSLVDNDFLTMLHSFDADTTTSLPIFIVTTSSTTIVSDTFPTVSSQHFVFGSSVATPVDVSNNVMSSISLNHDWKAGERLGEASNPGPHQLPYCQPNGPPQQRYGPPKTRWQPPLQRTYIPSLRTYVPLQQTHVPPQRQRQWQQYGPQRETRPQPYSTSFTDLTLHPSPPFHSNSDLSKNPRHLSGVRGA